MRPVPILIFLSLLGAASLNLIQPSNAQNGGSSSQWDRCMHSGDAALGITSGMLDCHQEELARRNAALNATYASLRRGLPPARFAKLRAAQREWIVRRDKRCWAKDPDFEGGTLATLNSMVCLIGQTKSRTLWLLRYR